MDSTFENDPFLEDLGLPALPSRIDEDAAPLPEIADNGNGDGNIDSAQEPESDDGQPKVKTHRDEQRGALQELVDLATECAHREAEIELHFSGATASGQTGEQHARTDADLKYESLKKKLAQKRDDLLQQIERRFKENAASIKAHDDALRRRIQSEYDAAQRDIKKKLEQALWLAESVMEASEGKAAEEFKKANQLYVTHKELLESKEQDGLALLNRYGQPTPQVDAQAAAQEAETVSEDPQAAFDRHIQTVDTQLDKLRKLVVPNMLVGVKPYLVILLLLGIAVAVPMFMAPAPLTSPPLQLLAITVGAAIVISAGGFFYLVSLARKQVVAAYTPLRHSLNVSFISNENAIARAKDQHAMDIAKAAQHQQSESQAAKQSAVPAADKATKKRDTNLKLVLEQTKKKVDDNTASRKTALADLEKRTSDKSKEIQTWYQNEGSTLEERTAHRIATTNDQHDQDRAALEKRWSEGLAKIQEPIVESALVYPAWSDPSWDVWKPPTKFPATVRFGQLQVDLKTIIAQVASDGPFTLPIPETFSVPALMAFPKQGSLMFHADRGLRMEAIRGIQMVMARLFTCLPAGRVRFTVIDPVGLGQNFAGFMHLTDYDEALIGGRILSASDDIDTRLLNLTEHMETVIQKYLRNEFETIDDYNAQAGELAEPYRYLVISDFPVNLSDEAMRRLASIASTGARCGVYTIVMRDTRVSNNSGAVYQDDLEAHSVNLISQDGRFVWRDPVFQQFPLTLDPPPTDDELTSLLQKVGKGAREAKRVEVPFENIAPKPDQFWTLHSDGDVGVAVGRSGATRNQMFRLGKGVAQHALVAGKTGSGKSTLMHALITNLAMWYSPDEIELYLIDFKKGVEFKTYAMHHLPHARAIAVESDREFGISVLQRIDQEMTRRADMFRPYKAQNLGMYREASGKPLPRTLLIIDEFQEFFSEDDKLSQDANLLLDRVVRQGRAFGVHLLLGSQTIGGSSGLSRSTIGQIGVRIALQTSEADSQMILGDGNSAARLLTRPGEAIYNDAQGMVEGNSPFQVAWLTDEKRDSFLDAVNLKVKQCKTPLPPPPIVFEGNEAADYRLCPPLNELFAAPKYVPSNSPPLAWLGDPVSIKAPTSIAFRRQSGSNVLVIGQNEEAALAMLSLSMIGLAAQLSPAALSFYMLDGTPTDSPLFGVLPGVAAALPHETKVTEYRVVGDAIHEIYVEMQKRQTDGAANPPAIFIMIFGMQRYRQLRKSEESFSFGGDEEKPPDPGKEFAELLREGPAFGIHVISWIDSATALDRTLDRGSMRELDHRILFQMSAADSSNLIDSPAANKLGANRALSYSEEQGSMEKFRPYAQPDAKWLAEIKTTLTAKTAG